MLDGVSTAAIYGGIIVAAAIEGEVVFVTAAALVSQGHLNPAAVATAGAIGACLGDQTYFYLLRGRLRRWLNRVQAIARRSETLVRRVRRHDTLMVLAIRFAPGLRIALAAACAYAGVPALKFSLLNALASIVWATSLLTLVAYLGPAVFTRLGISGWWGALVPALIIIVLFRLLSRAEEHAIESPGR